MTHSGGLPWALLQEAALGSGTAGSLKEGLVPFALNPAVVCRSSWLLSHWLAAQAG